MYLLTCQGMKTINAFRYFIPEKSMNGIIMEDEEEEEDDEEGWRGVVYPIPIPIPLYSHSFFIIFWFIIS